MELRVLKYFLTVAREENITRAAEILHISQPALSRQLMQLEEELGVQLFQRGRRNTSLTDEGMLLRRRAQEIVDLAEKTENEFRSGTEELSGLISIGSGEASTMRTLAELMQDFSERYPDVRFDLYSNNGDYIKERLERGTLDLGVLLGPTEISRYESLPLPGKERWGAIVPAKCPLAQKDFITPEDLVGRKVFMPYRGITQGVADWFGDCYRQMNVLVTYNLVYNAAMLVDCGVGAAITIDGAVALYQNPNVIFRPFSPELAFTSTLVWKRHQPMSRTVAGFIEFVRQNIPRISAQRET